VSSVLFERILVGTDGSATAGRAVDRAVALARATGASVTILSVGGKAAEIVARESGRHSDSGVEISTETRTGDPSAVLVDVADQGGYGLLVVGNRGMTGAARFFLGSVPNKVSHHTHRSLLIVRTS
jgi:nucleotide-binding universal stress UspA family protein